MGFVVAIAIAVVVAVVVALMYNRLIRSKNKVENAWSQIDVQLKRRLDLIPNLLEVVRGYAAHEHGTLQRVVQARYAAIGAPDTPEGQAAPSIMLDGALGRLLALSEAYPELKANQQFLTLQEELTATEGRVAYARQFYNDAVLGYNNKIESVPSVFVARTLGYARHDYFEAEESARTVPNVEF